MEAACPYCNVTLAKTPQRKTKCPVCGNLIHVKASPHDREKRLVTAARADEIEAEWREYHERNHWLSVVESFGYSEAAFGEKAAQLTRVQQSVSPRNVARSLLLQIATETARPSERKRAYFMLATIADQDGEDFIPFLQEAAKASLEHYMALGVARVEILTAGEDNACPACRKQEGTTLTTKDAFATMPLPCRRCSQTLNSERPGFCRCEYIPYLGAV